MPAAKTVTVGGRTWRRRTGPEGKTLWAFVRPAGVDASELPTRAFVVRPKGSPAELIEVPHPLGEQAARNAWTKIHGLAHADCDVSPAERPADPDTTPDPEG